MKYFSIYSVKDGVLIVAATTTIFGECIVATDETFIQFSQGATLAITPEPLNKNEHSHNDIPVELHDRKVMEVYGPTGSQFPGKVS
jgi:hypothetical protein